MTALRTQLDLLASHFTASVLEAIRAASLDELLADPKGSPAPRRGTAPGIKKVSPKAPTRVSPIQKASGRLARRSPDQIAKMVDGIVALLKKHKNGLRAEELRKELGMLPKEMPRILKEGLAAKKLKARGQKRATTYTAV
jgi:hypothetical protein